MKAAGRLYEPVTYEGADHGFMRLGDGYFIINRANKAARDQAFARLVTLWRERREGAKRTLDSFTDSAIRFEYGFWQLLPSPRLRSVSAKRLPGGQDMEFVRTASPW